MDVPFEIPQVDADVVSPVAPGGVIQMNVAVGGVTYWTGNVTPTTDSQGQRVHLVVAVYLNGGGTATSMSVGSSVFLTGKAKLSWLASVTQYEWDHHNRLTTVTTYTPTGTGAQGSFNISGIRNGITGNPQLPLASTKLFTYDVFDRLVSTSRTTSSEVAAKMASWVNGVITISTRYAHGLVVGQPVVLSGFSPDYNGSFVVREVIADDKFTVSLPIQARIGTAQVVGIVTSADTTTERFVTAQNQRILELRKDTPTAVESGVVHFNGRGVDVSLALDRIGATVQSAWTLTDQQGTVRYLAGTALTQGWDGQTVSIVEPTKYSAFGKPLSDGNPFSWVTTLYAGRDYDNDTGLYNLRARWYDPGQGRFISRDPIGFKAGDTNLYRYVGNSPANATDPSGQWALIDDAIALVSGAVIGVIGQGIGDLVSGNFSGWESYLGAAIGGAVGAEVLLYTANPILAGMAGGAAANGSTQLLQMASGTKSDEFDVGSFAFSAGMGVLGGAGGLIANRALGAAGASINSGLRRMFPGVSPETLCRVASPIVGGASGAMMGGAMGGIGGGIAGFWQGGWEGAWAGALDGARIGATTGAIMGFGQAAMRAMICFPAGTMLRTPTGSKPIEQFQVGDQILSRHEANPAGEVESKLVEEVFVRYGPVVHLHVSGQVIRTTGEHPFYAVGKGWTPAFELMRGDQLATMDGLYVTVEEVYDTGECETVYNLRVADYHTYFVGSEEWDFSIWAHNSYKGGPHREMSKPSGDGLESHHMPADSVNGIPAKGRLSAKGRGPAIQMDPDDHARTRSNGKMAGSGDYRAEIEAMIDSGNFRGAMAKEIRDVRRAAQEVSGDRTKYNQAMLDMLAYARSEGFIPPNPNRIK